MRRTCNFFLSRFLLLIILFDENVRGGHVYVHQCSHLLLYFLPSLISVGRKYVIQEHYGAH